MKNKIFILLITLSIFTLAGCGKLNAKSNNNLNEKLVNEGNIKSLRIFNIKAEYKDIKSKSEITKILDLVNSVNAVKSDVGIIGMGYGIEITYSDNKTETLSFMDTLMLYNGEWYKVDKNIENELRNIYNKN